MATAAQLRSAAPVRTIALAPTRPTEIGTSPACTATRQGAALKRSQVLARNEASTAVGPHIANVVTTAPASPATWNPTSVTNMKFEPGAAGESEQKKGKGGSA